MQMRKLSLLVDDVKARKGSFIPHLNPMWRDIAVFHAAHPQRSWSQLRAASMKELANIVELAIYPEWTLAGEHLNPGCGVEYGMKSLPDESSRRAALRQLGHEDKYNDIKKAVDGFLHQSCSTAPGEIDPKNSVGLGTWATSANDEVFWGSGWIDNHSIRDYEKLVRIGYAGLKKEVGDQLLAHPITDPDYPDRENFLRGALSVCEAGIALGRRYAVLAEQLAEKAGTPDDRKRLSDIAAICRNVPENGASTFREAVQSFWFAHLITCAEDGINANSLGHLDRIFDPYYQEDLAAGTITREQAVDLMAELAAKLYLDYDVQAITLGGVNADGSSAVTEMSRIILDATTEFGELRDLSVRVDRNTPEDFLLSCANMVIRGGGIPFFFNDECFIPALTDRGISLQDARTYSPIGCVELTIPGKANPHAVSGWFNLTKCLELVLHDGIDPDSGRQVGPRTGELEGLKTFASLKQAFFRQVAHFSSLMVYHCRRGEALQRSYGALPGWSLLTDDCIRRGRDITNGGAVYNYHSICLMGVPDTADALAAMEKYVYGDGSVSAGELKKAMKDNFQGHDALRQKLLKGAPKYGNGDEAPDRLAAELCTDFIGRMDALSTTDNRIFVHLFTFKINIQFGKKVGALPDGRLAGEPLAYSLSAHQGRDLAGVTALLRSLSRMPHHMAAGGSAAIIDLHPSILENVNGPEMLVQLIRTAMKMGVGQLQWNVVSAEQLQKAKADPEHYGNIPVRVAGYSQLFKLIEPELQDHIIARYKHKS
jgi:pyruvate-formate lyase